MEYNFNEVGSYQVNTSSGAYTLGIEDMYSGEASSYYDTFKDLLMEMNEDVRQVLFRFKGD